MRVLVVNHSSALDHLGGSERSTLALLDEWQQVDPTLDIVVVTKAPEGLFVDQVRQRGWPYRSFAYGGWAIPPHEDGRASRARQAVVDYRAVTDIVSYLRDVEPDLVLTNTLVAPWGAFAAGVVGVPHVWFVREFGDLDHGLVFLQGREKTLADIGRLSVAVVANSRAIRDHLAPHVDPAKLSICYPTVDSDALTARAAESPSRPPFPDAGDALRVTVTGRLTRSKGQHLVVEAIGLLARRGVRVDACFVGATIETGYDAALRARAAQLGIAKSVTIVGEQANPFPFVAAADLCVTPSSSEAFGRTTLEYLWLGKPVVAARGGGSLELISEGSNGSLFAADDAQSLAQGLERYARDPELLRDHARAARTSAEVLATGEFSNGATIRRLSGLPGTSVIPLPSISEQWFELPGELADLLGLDALDRQVDRERRWQRVGRLLRNPVSVVRRRMATRRHG